MSFAERTDLPVYHRDVRAYEVRDREGRAIGLFLHDNFARPNKHSGAWMSSYRDQEAFAGSEVVEEHPVAGADRRGELAQAQVSDPGVEGMTNSGGEQAFPGLRGAHG